MNMKKLLYILSVIIGLTSFIWGAKLIHYNYALQSDVIEILKTGNQEITNEIKALHSEQATKTLIVHLGLIVVGIVLVILPLFLSRKTCSKPLIEQNNK